MIEEQKPSVSSNAESKVLGKETALSNAESISTRDALTSNELEARFTRVFAANLWQDPESISGPGSRLDSDMVNETLNALKLICKEFSILSITDIPCGDLNWIRSFLRDHPTISYSGFDIVKPLVEQNNKIHPDIICGVLDITSQLPPKADLLLCKDLIIHLSDHDIKQTLDNIKKSGSKYLLASNNFGMPNGDLMENIHGDSACRYVDIVESPFWYPEPIWKTNYLGLWDLDSVPLFKEEDLLDNDTVLVRIAELYIYVNKQDWSYGHLMSDSRSQIVKPHEVLPLWTENELAPAPTWTAGMKGLPCLAWASLHLFQCGIDFDFLDIGANLGIEGIAQAILYKKCGWRSKVYLFEPGETYKLLEASVACNRISDIATVVNVAVTNTNGRERFYFLPNATGGSSLLKEKVSDPNLSHDVKELNVEAITIDAFVLNHVRKTPALIVKIDTEGADFKVIDGMLETLQKRIVIAQLEFIPSLIETYRSSSDCLAQLVKDFVLVNVGHGQQRHVISVSDIDDFIKGARRSAVPPDILLVPRKLRSAVTLLEKILSG